MAKTYEQLAQTAREASEKAMKQYPEGFVKPSTDSHTDWAIAHSRAIFNIYRQSKPGTILDQLPGYREHTLANMSHHSAVTAKIQEAARAYRQTDTGESLDIDPRWLTSDVVGLAQAIDQGHHLDRLPVLGDALQDAGCDNTHILNHCYNPPPKFRADHSDAGRVETKRKNHSWVVDLIKAHATPNPVTNLTRRQLAMLREAFNSGTSGQIRSAYVDAGGSTDAMAFSSAISALLNRPLKFNRTYPYRPKCLIRRFKGIGREFVHGLTPKGEATLAHYETHDEPTR